MTPSQESIPAEVDSALEAADDADALRRIPVNLYETGEALVVVAAMPAVMADDIDVRLDGTRLELGARLRTAAPKDYIVQEWAYGDYQRSVDLPREAGADPTATYGNGQLVVRLPLAGRPHQGDIAVSQAG